MLICLTGLHRAGKSHFSFESGIPQKMGFKVFNKKDIVAKLCFEFNKAKGINIVENVLNDLGRDFVDRNEKNELIWNFCNKWYGKMMAADPYFITGQIINKILDDARVENCDKIIIDAVHNNKEWEIIHELVKDSGLLLFLTPKEIRDQRSSDVNFINKQNLSRINYWCTDPNLPPLPYMALGIIDGSKSNEEIESDFLVFVEKLQKSFKNQRNYDYDFINPLDTKLLNLMNENELLALQNASMRKKLENKEKNENNENNDDIIK